MMLGLLRCVQRQMQRDRCGGFGREFLLPTSSIDLVMLRVMCICIVPAANIQRLRGSSLRFSKALR